MGLQAQLRVLWFQLDDEDPESIYVSEDGKLNIIATFGHVLRPIGMKLNGIGSLVDEHGRASTTAARLVDTFKAQGLPDGTNKTKAIIVTGDYLIKRPPLCIQLIYWDSDRTYHMLKKDGNTEPIMKVPYKPGKWPSRADVINRLEAHSEDMELAFKSYSLYDHNGSIVFDDASFRALKKWAALSDTNSVDLHVVKTSLPFPTIERDVGLRLAGVEGDLENQTLSQMLIRAEDQLNLEEDLPEDIKKRTSWQKVKDD